MHWIDPDCLPVTKGVVRQLIPNARGDLDGLVLVGEAGEAVFVHFPPHLSEQVKAVIKIGREIRVHAVELRGGSLAAVALVAGDGAAIVDNGPPANDDRKTKEKATGPEYVETEIAGCGELALYGPKGELRGALLEDGSVLRIGRKEASHFAAFLHPGAAVAARGKGLRTEHGTVIEAREIGPSLDELRPVKVKKLKEEEEPRHRQEDRNGAKRKPQEGPDALLATNP